MSIKLIIATVLIVIATVTGVWYVFIRPTSSLVSTAPTSVNFGNADERPGVGSSTADLPTNTNEPINASQYNLNDKIFQLAPGPVASVTLIQTFHPTTTLARFIKADTGRVFDLPLDVPGALPRAVSNTTIPGIQRVWWLPQGSGAIVQYENEAHLRKTLYIGLLNATTTLNSAANPQPTKIQYLPDNIADLSISPDGKQVTYLLTTANGSDGYLANFDGSSARKIYFVPLSQVLVSWPAPNTLLLQTKVGTGLLGAAFSVDVKTGSVSSLFFANALQALADRSFSRVIYQTNLTDGTRVTYVHDLARNKDTGLSLSPIPEKCVWATQATSTLYCAAPMQYVPPNYLDLWHAGVGSAADSLLSFNIGTGASLILATPGTDGGAASDMIELAPSGDNHYLSFVRKGDRTLWGIRLQ
ncbi:hypothetical protein KW798_01675 [Candidatus Parcubacteria bacterium]|nr:hypothetical protein [Candidatus Parcubacteria bacterium]